MKILWVKSGGFVPLDHGGKIRSYQLAKELARRHEVTLFTFYPHQVVDAHAGIQDQFARVICLPLQIPAPKSLGDHLGYAKNLFTLRPYSVAKYCQPQVAERLLRLLQEESFDLILCDFLLTGVVIPWNLPGPKVLFTHNIEARIWERHYELARNPIWKGVCYREFKAVSRMERTFLQRADHVLTVSEVDRDFFACFLDPAKITVIPTGVDVNYFRPRPEAEEPNTLAFTGSMDWLPNEAAIFFFVEQIFPHIRARIPDVSIWVVGRRPSGRLQALAAREKALRISGSVEDVRPYMGKASVYIVPLLVGGGTRLKIFEAMAMGKAIVSTSVGAEGLPVEPGKNILLADQAEQFAHHVITLLTHSEKRKALGRAARELVEKNYRWTSVAQELDRILVRVAESYSVGLLDKRKLGAHRTGTHFV